MLILRRLTAALAVTGLLLAGSRAGVASTPSTVVLGRLIVLDDGLHSYTANVHADIAMHSFPYLTPSLDGKYYHKEPSKDKIVFTSGVPFIAQQFSNVYPHVESPSRWSEVYVISTEGDDGAYTTFKLMPRYHSRIDHIDAKVADKTGELAQMRWNYVDGSYAILNQTYGRIGGYMLVTKQSGHFQDPNYDADVTSTFSNFQLNAQIPDSIFTN